MTASVPVTEVPNASGVKPSPKRFLDCGMITPPGDLAALRTLAHEAALTATWPPRFLEVGSFAGRTALIMGGTLPGLIEPCVYCIDTWEGSEGDPTQALMREHDVFQAFCQNAGEKLFRGIFPCRGPSEMWAKVWPIPLDLVFLDGDHRYEAVKRDIELWTPHVRRGGILCGHDYPNEPGVVQAVNESGGGQRMGRVWWRRIEN